MKQFVIRDEDERVLAKVNKVLSCSAEDTLANAKTLSFTTLLEGGLEKLKKASLGKKRTGIRNLRQLTGKDGDLGYLNPSRALFQEL